MKDWEDIVTVDKCLADTREQERVPIKYLNKLPHATQREQEWNPI
jgi:hypothetical protein